MSFLLLSSGFFLGWSLGANDGGNIFGPAVTTRMLKFKVAAIIAAIFVLLGALYQGGGATQTLSALGSVNKLSGSFTVALAAALSLFLMLKMKIPVSSSQAVVGAILGWNIFTGSYSGFSVLPKIVSTWIFTPILSAFFAIIFYFLFKYYYYKSTISLLRHDYSIRVGYIVLIAFSAYSLGANNIANVMGMFVDSSPFTPATFFNQITITSHIQLFFLGGLSIGVGILTKSMSNADTVGNTIFKMSPIIGFISILSSSLVLFLFSSKNMQILLDWLHLPTLPLVPVSSSQAIIGAIIGLGIIKGASNIQYKQLYKIALGWVVNPILAGTICFFSLFFMQNVFEQSVYTPTIYIYNDLVMEKLESQNINSEMIDNINDQTFENSKSLRLILDTLPELHFAEKAIIAHYGEYYPMYISTTELINIKNKKYFPNEVYSPLEELENNFFDYKWELADKLAEISEHWKPKPKKIVNDFYNSELEKRLELLYKIFGDDKQ